MRRPALEIAALLLLICSVYTDDQILISDDHDMYQREIVPELPSQDDQILISDDHDMYQREIVPELPSQVQLPFLIQGEPILSPRGRRPASPCGGRQPCPLDGMTDSFGSNLNTFPPGRPNRDNIENICNKERVRPSYGTHNLPRSGFGHLYRQGNAINELEGGFTECCTKAEKLRCAVEVWKNTLDNFCESEFSVKTRHHHCCKESGSQRETCFNNIAPNPSYMPSDAQQVRSEVSRAVGSPRSIRVCPPNSPKCQENTDSRYKLSDLAFPPGEPKSSNIQNICKLRKYRPLYTDNMLPMSGYSHYMRRAKTIQRMEGEFKKCCKTEDVACAHSAWKKVLGKFCAKEQIVKTKHHDCCKKRDETSMLTCFASEAPFPEYDREVEVLNLGNVTEDGLQKLCGETKLLTKQKQIPLLVSGLKEMCCPLAQDMKLSCVAEQKEKFIKTLCGAKKDSWKDTQDCCGKEELERPQCFTYYLQSVSMAVSHRTKVE